MEEMGTSSTSAKDNLSEINHLLKADILMEFSDRLAELSQKLIDFGKQSLEAFNEVDEGMDIIVPKLVLLAKLRRDDNYRKEPCY